MNTLPSRHKQSHFNLTMSLLYLVKLKLRRNNRLYLLHVRSVEPIVPDFRRKSFSVPFFSFPVCYKILSTVFWQKTFYIRVSFIKNLSSISMWLILAFELKLNCRDLRPVIVMTSSSNYVSKLIVITEYSFTFPLMEES